MRVSLHLSASLLVLTTLPAVSEEADKGPWSGTVALGYVSIGGNSDSQTANFATEVNYAAGRWHHTLKGSALGASRDGESTAEAYSAGWTTQYDIGTRYFLFGGVDWNKDKFSGYDRQLAETAGVGWRVLQLPSHQLELKAGGGARQSTLRDGSSENEAVGRLNGLYNWNITDRSSFRQIVDVISGSDNTWTQSVTELRAGIIGKLGLVLSYTLTRNSSVPAESRNTDTLATVALEYSF